jgi:predicted Rossmann fold flavoprotein
MYYDNNFDVVVIGGGASGMMAASIAGEQGKKVVLLEKNKYVGEKLKITGGGRCNITNNEADIRTFLENYGKAKDFLFSPFAQFSMKDTFDYFQSRGLQLVTQARNRVFPVTENAIDVSNLLERELKKQNVLVKTNAKVVKINHKDGKIESVETTQGIFTGKSYILATGGVSHPETGSTGDGFKWLEDLGHTVKSPTPTIVPLAVANQWVKSLAGVSLTFIKITFYLEGKKAFSKTGKILFTHFGLSSPLILNSAAEVGELLLNGEVTASIDTYPDTDLGALDAKVVSVFDANKNKSLKNVLKDIVPHGTVRAFELLLDEHLLATPVHSVSKADRKKFVQLLKAMPVEITGLMGNDRAVSADGGVILEEIDMRTMKSKVIENMYVTGDLLHINRPSGGYSLQLCWTTGYIAGINS